MRWGTYPDFVEPTALASFTAVYALQAITDRFGPHCANGGRAARAFETR